MGFSPRHTVFAVCALLTMGAFCTGQGILEERAIEPCDVAQGWGVSRDASTYFKGVSAATVTAVPGRKPGSIGLCVQVAFADASESETVFVSKQLPQPVDASEYNGVALWYRSTSDKIAEGNGFVLRLRDATAKQMFIDLPFATRSTVVPGEWCHAVLPFPARPRFDPSAVGTVTFRIDDIDYYNVTFELAFDDIRLVKLDVRAPEPYEPRVLSRTPGETLDVLLVRPGGARNFNLARSVRTLPVPYRLELCDVLKNYTNPWFLASEHGRTHWLSAFPASHDELLAFDVVILAGISADALTEQQQRLLLDFVASGGGLLVVGGPSAFGSGNYAESELARLLPVDVQRREPGGKDYERVKGRISIPSPHPVTDGIPVGDLAHVTYAHGVTPRADAITLLQAGEHPVLVAGQFMGGRVLALPVFHKAYYKLDDLFHARCFDELIRQSLAWLTSRPQRARILTFTPPPSVLVRGETATAELRASGPVGWRARGTVLHEDRICYEELLDPGENGTVRFECATQAFPNGKGSYGVRITVVDADGTALARRDAEVQVVPRIEVDSVIQCGQAATAKGYIFEPSVRCTNRSKQAVELRVSACVRGPGGAEIHRFDDVSLELAAKTGAATHHYAYTVPNLRNGDYTFGAAVCDPAGRGLDSCVLPFHVVREFDPGDAFVISSFPGVAVASETIVADETYARNAIDELIAHGFNAVQVSGRMGRLGPKLANADRVAAGADSYAQRRGMGIHVGCGSLVLRFGRDRPPTPCVNSPEHQLALDEFLAPMIAWTHKIPRLVAATLKDEPTINAKMFCRCEHCGSAFRKQYGAELPESIAGLDDPKRTRDVFHFYSAYMARVWQASADTMHRGNPRFRARSNYTHSLVGRNRVDLSMGDLLSWSEPLDVLSTTGGYPYIKGYPDHERVEATFQRRACMLACLRNVAAEQHKPFGAWFETCIPVGAPVRAARRNVYATIGSGATFLTAWYNGIDGPHPRANPELWEDLGQALHEVADIGPLLLRLRRRASVALLFPQSDWVLSTRYSGPFGRLLRYYDLLSASLGNVDMIWERQIAAGDLRDYRVLVLPGVVHLRQDAASAIRDFVLSGGLLIADRVPGLDELARPMSTLRELFGASVEDDTPGNPGTVVLRERDGQAPGSFLAMAPRRYRALAGATVLAAFTDPEGPAIVTADRGKGKALLLAFDGERTHLEMGDQGGFLRSFIRQSVEESAGGLEAYSDNAAVGCNYLEAPGCAFVVLVNRSERQQACRIIMRRLPCRPQFVCDMADGRSLPAELTERGAELPVVLAGLCGQVIGLYAGKPSTCTLEMTAPVVRRGEQVSYRARLAGGPAGVADGSYVLKVRVTDPAGMIRPEYGRLACSTNGCYEGGFQSATNDPVGTWRIMVSEKVTGVAATAAISVRE